MLINSHYVLWTERNKLKVVCVCIYSVYFSTLFLLQKSYAEVLFCPPSPRFSHTVTASSTQNADVVASRHGIKRTCIVFSVNIYSFNIEGSFEFFNLGTVAPNKQFISIVMWFSVINGEQSFLNKEMWSCFGYSRIFF